ncbi:hypothetical protein I3760_08G110900 [Carya illinoinensis]|nr:hypothetical protein I3760_08G110900 [Carya illinoinensis]
MKNKQSEGRKFRCHPGCEEIHSSTNVLSEVDECSDKRHCPRQRRQKLDSVSNVLPSVEVSSCIKDKSRIVFHRDKGLSKHI